MLQTHSPTKPRSAATTEIPLSLAETRGAVRAGLVPMPAETAGYLLLGLADLLVKAPMPLQERAILLSGEGTLSMLALSTTSRQANADEGGLERKLRALLGQLLEHAPSSAPSLTVVARRPPQGNLPALIRELEGALIPVNRSAGKRALARLQREVERVRHRIPASPPPPSVVSSEPAARPAPQRAAQPQARHDASQRHEAKASRVAPMLTAPLAPIPSLLPPTTREVAGPAVLEASDATEVRAPVSMEVPDALVERRMARPAAGEPAAEQAQGGEPAEQAQVSEPAAEPLAGFEVIWTSSPPMAEAIDRIAAATRVLPPRTMALPEDEPEESPGARAETRPLPPRGGTTVEQMLARWSQQEEHSEREGNRWLKQSVGIEPSALPPGVETFAPPVVAASIPWQAAPEVALIMPPLPEPPSFSPRPPRRPRATLALTTGLLLLGLAVTLALWIRAPGFFSGHLP